MKKNVILVEDDQAIIEVYKTAFEAVDHINLEVMRWGRDAIDKIKEIREKKLKKPNLVIIDLILPDIDGTEILREIKGNPETKDILVFILSNYTSPENAQKQEGEIKPDKFILKTSITPLELAKLINEAIK